MTGLGEIAERLRRSTVEVRAGRNGSGSGVIWNTTGTVVTNAHVVRDATATVELWDGRELSARVVERDSVRDLARLETGAVVESARPGDSGRVRPGALVIAIGSPFGFTGALTRGVIHGVGALPGLGRRQWIQSAIRLAPGNSGGPLADAAGGVIGINTMIYGGLGLAVPSADVERFLAGRRAPRLGVTVRPVRYGAGMGLLVLGVEPGSAAANASLLLGDVLLGTDGRAFRSPKDLSDALEQSSAIFRLDFARGGRAARSVAVTLHPGARAA